MRPAAMKRRGGRAVLALLVGLFAGGWIGGGLVWVLNRHKYSDPETVLDVNLGKADEVEMVPADAMGFVHLRLRDLWKTEAMAEFRKVLERAGPEALKALDEGFVPAPSSIERATLVVLRPDPQPGPMAVPKVFAILAFSSPFDADQVRRANFPAIGVKNAGGKEYWQDAKSGLALHFPSDRVIVLGTGPAVQAYLSAPPKKEGPVAAAIGLAARGERHLVAAVNMGALPVSIRGQIDSNLPDEARTVLRADAISLGMVLDRGMKVDLRAGYKDDEAAANAEKAIRGAADEGRKKLAEAKKKMEEQLHGKPGAKKPRSIEELPEAVGALFALGAINMLDAWLADPGLERKGSEVAATVTMPSLGNAYMTTTAASIGLLLPAVQKTREAAARMSDSNNLKQMGLAMHNYHSAYNRLPPSAWGTKVENGRQTGKLSWRVAVLPFMEQGPLYEQFHHDESWDSEHNKKLIPKMPRVYVNPRAPTEPGKTYYKVFVGGGAIFDRDPLRSRSLIGITDGTSNTIMIAEGGEPVIWTKPDDFEFDPKKPLNLAIPGMTGVNVCMADGSVRFLDLGRISPQTLKAAITASGGEVLGRDW